MFPVLHIFFQVLGLGLQYFWVSIKFQCFFFKVGYSDKILGIFGSSGQISNKILYFRYINIFEYLFGVLSIFSCFEYFSDFWIFRFFFGPKYPN